MKLEDVKELLVNDKNKTLRPSNNNIVKDEDLSDFGFLFIDIHTLLKSKSFLSILKAKSKIKRYKVVNKVTFNFDKKTHLKSIYLETKYGNGIVLTDGLFFDMKDNPVIQKGQCHSNAMVATAKIGMEQPEFEPKVLTGIADFKMPGTKPFLHSVYQIKSKNYGDLIIDHNIDLSMSPSLYDLFLHLEVIGEFYPWQWDPLFEKLDLCNKELEKRGKSHYKGTNIYAILAYDETMKYLDELIENKREDDFPFKVEKQTIKKEI